MPNLEYRTTTDERAYNHDDEESPDPIRPDGDGWVLVGFSAVNGRDCIGNEAVLFYWVWARPDTAEAKI